MSAFIVENVTINSIVTILNSLAPRHYFAELFLRPSVENPEADPAILGQHMADLNDEAIRQRYGENAVAEMRGAPYAFHWAPHCSEIQAYKYLRCWLYQCTEGDVSERPLYKAADDLAQAWADDFVNRTPEYQQAKWA